MTLVIDQIHWKFFPNLWLTLFLVMIYIQNFKFLFIEIHSFFFYDFLFHFYKDFHVVKSH